MGNRRESHQRLKESDYEDYDKENRMMRYFKKLLSFAASVMLCIAVGIGVAACADETKESPVKIADGTTIELAVGDSETITVADYITANGNEVTVQSSDTSKATAQLTNGVATVTAVAEGSADISLACGEIQVIFEVIVTAKTEQPQEPQAPVKVKDGIAFELETGGVRTFQVSEYITANGNEVAVQSSDPDKASAVLADGVVTVTAVTEGSADVTLTCLEIEVTFSVSVYRTYTVSVDGVETQVRSGEEYILPQASIPSDPDFEFVAWQVGGEQKQPGEKIIVNSDVEIASVLQRKSPVKIKDGGAVAAVVGTPYTVAVADYITTYGNEVTVKSSDSQKVAAELSDGMLTLTPKWAGNAVVTLACGGVTVEFSVTVKAAEVSAPVFENGTISFDLFERQSGTYEFEISAPEGIAFEYQYEVTPDQDGVSISGNVLTYTASKAVEELVLTVSVTATAEVTGETVEKTASFTVTIHVADSTPKAIEESITVPGTVDLYAGEYIVDLSENIAHAENIVSYTVNGEPVSGKEYLVAGEFDDVAKEVVLNIVGKVDDLRSVSYTYLLNVIDSTAYRMSNGGFEEEAHGSGWTGMTGHFDNYGKYFESVDRPEGYPVNNDGWYYIGIDGATEELSGTETVVSPSFVVGNSGWITFKLGSMRPNEGAVLRNIYLEVVEDVADGDDIVLAQVRNIGFKDPDAALRLNDYKLDLSEYKGKTVYIRAVDQEDGGNYRSLYLDAFVTWYDAEPSDAFTDLTYAYFLDTQLSIDLKDFNQGTVTPVFLSRGLMSKEYTYAAQTSAEGLTADGLEITASKSGEFTLTYTVMLGEEKIGTFEVLVKVSNSTQIPQFEDIRKEFSYETWYVEGTPQSVQVQLPQAEADGRFDYSYSVTGAQIEGSVLTYTPAAAGSVSLTVTLTLNDRHYPVTDLPVCTFTVTLVFQDSEITLAEGDEIERSVDVNDADDKEKLVVDFSEYLVIPDGAEVTYSVTLNDTPVEMPDGTTYTIVYAEEDLSDTPKEFVFEVTAASGEKRISFKLTFSITDTYQYRLANGGFDRDLEGWTLSHEALGGISEETGYWPNDPSGTDPLFYNDGKFFSAYAPGASEGAVGTLTSSVFTVGGSGWITYKLGGAKNLEQVYMQVISADDGSKIVTLPNFDWSDVAGSLVRGCTLVAYKANLIEYGFAIGEKVYIQITDQATGDYGLFFLDSVTTYYPVGSEPDDSFRLVSRYRIYNGGFETGNLTGWTLSRAEGSDGDIGVVTSQDTYWQNTGLPTTSYGKDGTYLFSFWTWDGDAQTGHETNREGFTGTLTSSTFTLKAGATVCFLLGGGGGNQNVYLEFVNAQTDEVIAKFMNTSPADAQLIRYFYEFTELTEDTECYIRVTDNATSGWGCFTLDGIEVNCEAAPEDYLPAVNQLSVSEQE